MAGCYVVLAMVTDELGNTEIHKEYENLRESPDFHFLKLKL